ncbi:33307_t:CDS:2 [Racocetra persica]|uniref:33307_t:CDS:1 n=1 Tax=Racocetra persica TaxID=160502 RepID=A0ACA9L7C9_9GLOM|nr:33307_t:CDS:2 [Racocetra persica]
MVDSQTWLDQNYPDNGLCIRVEDSENYNKPRNAIVINLDISNQNLKGNLQLGSSFSKLKKFNCSFNKLTELGWGSLESIEEIDQSHNQINGSKDIQSKFAPNLKKLNFSDNYISGFNLSTPKLAYLDATNNLLTSLVLNSTSNLVELKCSNNSISSLTLSKSFNLVLFDCFDVKLVTMVPTPTSSLSSQSTSRFPTDVMKLM